MPVALRWGDMDAYGHVNNVEILRLIEEARVRVIWRTDGAGENLSTAVLDPGVGDVLTVVLVVELLAMLERHVEDAALAWGEGLVQTSRNCTLDDLQGKQVGAELVGMTSQHVARKLVKQHHGRKRGAGVAQELVGR